MFSLRIVISCSDDTISRWFLRLLPVERITFCVLRFIPTAEGLHEMTRKVVNLPTTSTIS